MPRSLIVVGYDSPRIPCVLMATGWMPLQELEDVRASLRVACERGEAQASEASELREQIDALEASLQQGQEDYDQLKVRCTALQQLIAEWMHIGDFFVVCSFAWVTMNLRQHLRTYPQEFTLKLCIDGLVLIQSRFAFCVQACYHQAEHQCREYACWPVRAFTWLVVRETSAWCTQEFHLFVNHSSRIHSSRSLPWSWHMLPRWVPWLCALKRASAACVQARLTEMEQASDALASSLQNTTSEHDQLSEQVRRVPRNTNTQPPDV